MSEGPLTVLEVLRRAAGYFAGKGVATPRLDAEVLLAHVLGMQRIQLYVNFDRPMGPEELAAYRHATAERGRRVPVAYITGKKEFFGLEFKVTPAVLIPRPETEILVEQVLAWAAQATELRLRIADIGAGSGAIAVALAVRLPEAEVWATDVSPAALEVATENAKAHGVADRVRFRLGNLAEPLLDMTARKDAPAGRSPAGFFDIAVSNPPYVADKDVGTLAPELAYEPRAALCGGADGVMFYPELLRQAGELLREGGILAVEIGSDEGAAVREMAGGTGVFDKIRIAKDYAGLDRVIVAERVAAGR